ncbi:hypothetical protein MRB53_039636 [Persea americana]|nr:hypothetical protein MRB53_039636 [Persea americana]
MATQTRTMPAVKTLTASIARRKWSVWATAIAAPHARTSAFSYSSMQTSQSSRRRRKAMACAQRMIYDRINSYSSTLARSSAKAPSGVAWCSMMRKGSSISTSCPSAKASSSMRRRKVIWAVSATTPAIRIVMSDKWVVGDKLRMGIFASRTIAAGEELVFNYNVDRYGANPQPCYCGEPNCTGYIGGKTQTERATKLSALTIEALGIEDGEDWDTAVARKSSKKKKTGEDDEEYVDSLQPKSLDEGSVTKVMATLAQCKEKWITVKLLSRIEQSNEEKILNILDRFPRLTRNKIQDSKIEDTIAKLVECEDEAVREQSAALLKIWSALEVGYRIPRMKRDPNVVVAQEREERRRAREQERSRSRSFSPDHGRALGAPSGPRGAQRFAPRPAYRRPFPPNNPLPAGWFSAQSGSQTYYYSSNGQTTWTRPTQPATQPPPPPPKIATHEQKLQELINNITKSATPKDATANATPNALETPSKSKDKERKEKWRSYSEEKRKKLYENTVAKKLVASDFKNGRVQDPAVISHKQEKQVKKYVKEYFDKAVLKKVDHDRKKAEKRAHGEKNGHSVPDSIATPTMDLDSATPIGSPTAKPSKEDEDIALSENEVEDDDDAPSESQISPDESNLSSDNKRKREADETPLTVASDGDDINPSKRTRSESEPPPPPPPPPPPGAPPEDDEPQSADPMDMVQGSFTNEALEAVQGAA